MRPSLFILSIACVLASGAHAMARDCSKLHDATQTDLNQCESGNSAAADEALNDKYRRLTTCLKGAPSATALLQSERAWLAFRDAECSLRASASEGGSVQPMIHARCLADITGARSRQLDFYLTCQEGDLACPVAGCGK